MNSLFELNTYSAQSLTYTDNRPATILFDRFEALDQEVFTTQNKRTYMPFGMNIAELNTDAFEVIFEIDLTGMSNGIPLWDVVPGNWTVYNPSGAIYRVLGIQSNYDWFLARLVKINSSAVIGDYTYKASIIYTKNGTTITHDWNILCHVGIGVAMSSSHTMSAYAGQTQLFEVAARSRSIGYAKSFRILATGNAALSAAGAVRAQPLKLRQLDAALSMNSLTAIFPNRIVRYAAAGSSTHTMTVVAKKFANGNSDATTTFTSSTITPGNNAVFDITRVTGQWQATGGGETYRTVISTESGFLGGLQTGSSMSTQGYGLSGSLDGTYIVTMGRGGQYQDTRGAIPVLETNQFNITTWTWDGSEYIKGYVLPSNINAVIDMSPDGNYVARYNSGGVAVYRSTTPGTGPYTEIAGISVPTPDTNFGGYGISVSMANNSDYLVVTTYGANESSTAGNNIYVYQRSGTTYTLFKTVTPSTFVAKTTRAVITSDGNYILTEGGIYRYEIGPQTWVLQYTITPSANPHFGRGASFAFARASGNVAIVDGRVFRRSGTTWTETADYSSLEIFQSDFGDLERFNTNHSATAGAVSPDGSYIALGGRQRRVANGDLLVDPNGDYNTKYPANPRPNRYQGQDVGLASRGIIGDSATFTTFTWSGTAWVKETDLTQTPISSGWDDNTSDLYQGIGRHMFMPSDNKRILVTDSVHGARNTDNDKAKPSVSGQITPTTQVYGGVIVYKKQ